MSPKKFFESRLKGFGKEKQNQRKKGRSSNQKKKKELEKMESNKKK
jgi:hypothetical protein